MLQQWECLLLSCHRSFQMDLSPANRCHHLDLAKDLHEISPALRVIRYPRQYYQAECIQID